MSQVKFGSLRWTSGLGILLQLASPSPQEPRDKDNPLIPKPT